MESGDAAKFISKLDDDDDDSDNWNTAQDEAFLFDYCRDLYKSETAVYDALKDRQGKCIHRLLQKVLLDPNVSVPASNPLASYFEVPGVLLERIEGFSLEHIHLHVPMEFWQDICDKAIKIVNCISHRGILNEDVKTRNVIVRKKGRGYDVVMIDFAQCRFRERDESEKEWKLAKQQQDEEGAIGYVMQGRLKKGAEIKYKPTREYRGE